MLRWVLAALAVIVIVGAFLVWQGFGAGIIPLTGAVALASFVQYTRTPLRSRMLGRTAVDTSPTAPVLAFQEGLTIDLGEELADLLKTATVRVARQLEDKGRFDPFVMYEDAGGTVRVRQVPPDAVVDELTAARTTARSIDPTAPRLVLAVAAEASIGSSRKREPVVVYEAAERRFRDRTLAFVQRRVPRRIVIPATTKGRPIYVGDAAHTLRFSGPGAADPA